jgi:ribose 1,5-bisphosphokinase
MTCPNRVWVVGPSGAGKDSVIQYARRRLSGNQQVDFVERWVTRSHTAPGEQSITQAALEQFSKDGLLAQGWAAHGQHYGLARERLECPRPEVRVQVVNISRTVITALRARYGGLVVEIRASPEQLQARLAQRQREDPEAWAERLARQIPLPPGIPLLQIHNDGPLPEAGDAFVTLLERMAESA